MRSTHPRMLREWKTIQHMIRIYCRGKHPGHAELCPQCADLRDYVHARLDHCPFQEEKSTCAHCAVHCYRADMRERIRVVMRFSGPRMLLHHPYLALMHLLVDDRRPAPVLKKRGQ
mgnify:CR=1 FL=1